MMENLRTCSRCKSEVDLSYFGMSRKKEPYKTCDNCRYKNTNKQNIKATTVIAIDVEIQNYVLTLLSTYSTNKLNRLMLMNNSKHVLAYAEAKLKTTNTTFRDLSSDDVLPVIL